MSTVDEIIATGRYTDRRGREWIYDTKHRFWLTSPDLDSKWRTWDFGGPFDEAQMRLLIERDQHRGECPGLYRCHFHPVPIVWRGPASGDWCVDYGNWHDTLPEAMDAARALAVGT